MSLARVTNKPPLSYSGAAVYGLDTRIATDCTRVDRFDREFQLHKVCGDRLWVPRAICPVGPNDERVEGRMAPFKDLFKPRHQEQGDIVHQGRKLVLAGESYVLDAPTGYGKTFVGCGIIAPLQRRTLVITTKEDILGQWRKAAREVLGLDDEQIGYWRGDEVPLDTHHFVIALVQSVMKGPPRYPHVEFGSFGVVITDEVHRMGAEEFSNAMWWFPAKVRLGMSATTYRKDGREDVFFAHIGPVRLIAKTQTMVPRVIVKSSQWKVPKVPRWDDVRREKVWIKIPHEPGKTMHLSVSLSKDGQRNTLIANFLGAARRKDRNTIVFCDTIDHLREIHSALIDAGFSSADIGYYVGLTAEVYSGSKKERQRTRDAAKLKPVILATYQMASEATDIPWLDTCVLGTPRSDVVQIVGRIRREYPDKPTPVVLDIVDDDSPVFAAYARKRMRWYKSLGCEVRGLVKP